MGRWPEGPEGLMNSFTSAARRGGRPRSGRVGPNPTELRAVVVPAVLRILPEQLRLQPEDVIQDSVDPPPLEPVVSNHPGTLEIPSQRRPQRTIDACLTSHLRLLEQLEASVQGNLLRPVRRKVHSVPSTSTRPAAVTRTWTLLSAGST